METERSAILRRIRKLLALAGGKGSEAEAAAAVTRAHALLAEHNLAEADVRDSVDSPTERILDDSTVDGARDLWPAQVWNATAMLHFCRYFYSEQFCGKRRIGLRHSLVGRPHNIDAAKLTARYLVDAVERLARESGRDRPQPERRSYQASFRCACGLRLAERIHARYRELATASEPASSLPCTSLPALLSLYVRERAENDALLSDRGIELGAGSASHDRLTHAGGAEAGRIAADSIVIPPRGSRPAPSSDAIPGQLDLFPDNRAPS